MNNIHLNTPFRALKSTARKLYLKLQLSFPRSAHTVGRFSCTEGRFSCTEGRFSCIEETKSSRIALGPLINSDLGLCWVSKSSWFRWSYSGKNAMQPNKILQWNEGLNRNVTLVCKNKTGNGHNKYTAVQQRRILLVMGAIQINEN